MLDTDTFLTTLYVMADDFAKTQTPTPRPGPQPALSDGEVLTLALFGQFYFFRSERDFYRFALSHLKAAFPRLPDRSQYNRVLRDRHDLIVDFFRHLGSLLCQRSPYEALDTTALPVRNPKRGGPGHLAGQAAIGRSRRLHWYEGFHLLVASTPSGVVTGFGFSEADVREVRLCETFLALRAHQQEAARAGLACVGQPTSDLYVADKGFEGRRWRQRWRRHYQADVISPPKHSSTKRRWGAALSRQMAGLRQIIETSIGALEAYFGLQADRPHHLSGLRARLAAKMALFDFCIWLNRSLGRADLAFSDLVSR